LPGRKQSFLVERVAHFVSFSRPIAAAGGDRAGMLCACERELITKLVHRARQARWVLNVTLVETIEEFFYNDFA